MYNYGDIKLQNKQDSFSAMYLYVSRSILELCGRRTGEKICREAMRRAGRESGMAQREKLQAANVKLNLQTLFHCGLDYVPDPRFRGQEIFNEEERQIYEVYTCPMADFWNSRDGGKLGSFFCEEYHYARLLAFTGGVGQLCLSNSLTCPRDNFCRISTFYREANLTAEEAKASFAHCDPGYTPPQPPADADFGQGVARLAVGVYYYLLETAQEICGQEGVCAVAEGLKQWAAQAVEALRVQAVHTLLPVDADFVAKNFVLSTDSASDPLWQGHTGHNARELMQTLVLDTVVQAEE